MSGVRKSRHGLTRCPSCASHTRAAATPKATSCHFCGQKLDTVRAKLRTGRGELIAASLFALSTAACGSATVEPQQPDESTGEVDDQVATPIYGIPADEEIEGTPVEPEEEAQPGEQSDWEEEDAEDNRIQALYGVAE